MSGSDWGEKSGPWIVAGALAFLAFVLIGLGVLNSNIYEAVYHDYATQKAHVDAEDKFRGEMCREFSTVEDIRGCFDKAIKATRETQRSEEDLYAQKQMAQWAFWLLLLTGFVGIVSIAITSVGTYFLIKTVGVGIKANSLARETMIAQTRPWLQIKQVKIKKMEITNNRIFLDVDVEVKNVGHSPALGVSIHGNLVIFGGGSFEVPDTGRKPTPKDGVHGRVTVFKDWTPEVRANLLVQAIKDKHSSDVDFAEKNVPEHVPFAKSLEAVLPFILLTLTVQYEFIGSDKIHTTHTYYMVWNSKPGDESGSGIPIPFEIGVVDLSSISLINQQRVVAD
jgi:hypothetical protein